MMECDKLETFLTENAFISMVTAAVETFPDETIGVLIGLQTIDRILVQYAIAYQTAERSKDKVQVSHKRSQRTDLFLQKVTRLEVVGDFHSHPQVPTDENYVPIDKARSIQLSPTDKHSMMERNIEIVIAIERDEKQREWKHLPKGSLKGCVFPYSLKIASWYKTKKEEFKIAKIHCPFALGLGR